MYASDDPQSLVFTEAFNLGNRPLNNLDPVG